MLLWWLRAPFHRPTACVHGLIDVGSIARVGNTRLQGQQVGDVAAFHGKGFDLVLVKRVPHRSVACIDENKGGPKSALEKPEFQNLRTSNAPQFA